MNYARVLPAVLIMAAVTYAVRMAPLVFLKRKISSRFLQSFLHYIPYAVLAAMTLPDILSSTAGLASALVGLGAALVLAYFNKGLLTVALGSTAAVFLTERLIALMF